MRPKIERPRARKRFGQHFVEPVWAEKVVNVVGPRADEQFLEIGPGTGAITRLLAARARAVVACEVDRDLAAALSEQALANVRVLTGDFLTLPESDIAAALTEGGKPATSVRVAANLPYNVASPIMFRLLDFFASGIPLTDATLMLQREVADRLLADPNSRDYGVLTVLVRHRASVARLLDLPPGAFRPAPKVRSTVVRLRFHPPTPPAEDAGLFNELVAALFSRRRKTLGNALLAFRNLTPDDSRSLLNNLQLESIRRPETMYIDELVALGNAVSRHCLLRGHQLG